MDVVSALNGIDGVSLGYHDVPEILFARCDVLNFTKFTVTFAFVYKQRDTVTGHCPGALIPEQEHRAVCGALQLENKSLHVHGHLLSQISPFRRAI